ncbi:MAG: hypothetical protein KF823_13580 [Xanthomonadales bacterium]|nr:hypothetical protein [Xanthomonadales bacterium]
MAADAEPLPVTGHATRATARHLFAALFAVLAMVRLYEFARLGRPPELLAGLGFVLLAVAAFRDARAAAHGGATDTLTRGVGLGGLALVAAAIVLRLMA